MSLAEDNIIIRTKIVKGLNLAFEKLLAQKVKNNGFLVFSEGDKIVRIKASELKR